MHCQYCDNELSKTFTIRQHYQRSIKCSEAIRHRIAQYIQKVELISQKWQKKVELIEQKVQKQIELIEQKVAKRTEIEIIEVAKSTSILVNIDIFDSTLMRDIEKFDLYSKMLRFLQYFQQIQHQYRELNVFDLLLKCVRDFVFAWFNSQSNFIIIQNFDKSLTCAFFIFIEFATKTSNQSSLHLIRMFRIFRFNIIRASNVSLNSRQWFDFWNISNKKSFVSKSFANIASKISISKINFTITYANNISSRVFDSLHQNSRTKSRKNQQSFARLFRLFHRFFLQHLHRYLNQYYQNVRISLLRHSISHQNRWRNYQSIVHLHFRFHLFEHLYQNIKNFILLSMIWFACFVKNLNHLIHIRIKKILFFRNVSTFVHHVNHVFSLCINHE